MSECSICQNQTKEKLHSSVQGHKTLASLLPKFTKLNVLGFDLARLETPGLTPKESLLNCNNVVYCHSSSKKTQSAKVTFCSRKI